MLSIKRSPWKSSVACCKNNTKYLSMKILFTNINSFIFLFEFTNFSFTIQNWKIVGICDLITSNISNNENIFKHYMNTWVEYLFVYVILALTVPITTFLMMDSILTWTIEVLFNWTKTNWKYHQIFKPFDRNDIHVFGKKSRSRSYQNDFRDLPNHTFLTIQKQQSFKSFYRMWQQPYGNGNDIR